MGAAFIFYLPEKSRIFAFSPQKVRFKKSVKYKTRFGINYNWPPEAL
jgi:hypothetical protein